MNLATFAQLVPQALFDAVEEADSGEVGDEQEGDVKPGIDPCPMGSGASCRSTDDCDDGLTCTGGLCDPGPAVSPIPMVVRVRVTTDSGASMAAGRVINLRFLGKPNLNPKPGRLKVRSGSIELSDALTGCAELGPFGAGLDEVPLEYVADDDGLESYATYRSNECAEVDESDEVLISWYTSQGRLDNALGSLEFARNVLTPEPDGDLARLYVAIRDGRGGLVVSCVDLSFGEAEEP